MSMRKLFRINSLNVKMICILLIIIVFLFLSLGLFIYINISTIIKSKVIESEKLSTNEVVSNLEDNMIQYQNILDVLAKNPLVGSVLEGNEKQLDFDVISKLSELFFSYEEYNKYIGSISLYMYSSGESFTYPRGEDILSAVQIAGIKKEINASMIYKNGQTGSEAGSKVMVYSLNSISSGEAPQLCIIKALKEGFLLILVKNDIFDDFKKGCNYFIMNEAAARVTFSHTQTEKVELNEYIESSMRAMKENDGGTIEGLKGYVIKRYLSNANLYLLCEIPMEYVYKEIHSIGMIIVIVALIVTVMFFTINILVVRRISKPLANLSSFLDSIDLNNPVIRHSSVDDKGILYKVISKLNLKDKLFITFTFFTVLPIVIFMILGYYRSSIIILGRAHNNMTQAVTLSAERVDRVIDSYQRKIRNFMTDHEVQDYLISGEKNIPEKNAKIQNILVDTIMDQQILNVDISNLILFDKEGRRIFSLMSSPFSKTDESTSQRKIDNLSKSHGKPAWTGIEVDRFGRYTYSVAWEVRGYNKGVMDGKVIGYIIVYFNVTDIENIFVSGFDGKTGNLSIIDNENRYVACQDRSKLGKAATGISYGGNTDGGFIFNKDRKAYIYFAAIKNTGWEIVVEVMRSDLTSITRKFLVNNLLVLAFCIIIVLLVFNKVAAHFKKRLRELEDIASTVENGDISIRYKGSSGDEIEALGKSFNKMLMRIDGLINEVTEARVKEKELDSMRRLAELKALHAQINPHFLYNTLESINSLAMIKGISDISRIAVALGNMLRFSVKKGSEFVEFKDEIEHSENYMKIQKIRYCELLEYSINIDPKIYSYMCVKLILQPFLENAIYHGIEDLDGGGMIELKGIIEGNDIKISISDNGVGMEEEILKELNESLETRDGVQNKGIGMVNVNRRIKLYFGDNYGVKVLSKKGVGTTVEIYLPCIGASDNVIKGAC